MIRHALSAMTLLFAAATAHAAGPGPAQQAILDHYRQLAGVQSFSPERGRAFFLARHQGGKPETPSCTTCHTDDPHKPGRTRAGKRIDPMALSVNPQRYTDLKKVEKWFRRNCRSVLGRECTAREKGDFLAFMYSQ